MQYAAYKRAQRYLEALPQQVFAPYHVNPVLSLERTRRLLAAVGHPERGLRYVHVTGTSGKGSVTMMVHDMLAAAGKRVGAYFSPHVTTTTERMLINGRLVSVADFLWAFAKVRPIIQRWKAHDRRYITSHFESLFAMSLLVFQKHRVAWVVLEVGCGGEFDATNVIPPPTVAVVTNIGLDHQELLGRTRTAIAKTKAGIFKRGSLAVSGERDPNIQRILQRVAARHGVPLTFIPPPRTPLPVRMLGQHQQHNAAMAKAVAKHLKLSPAAITKGLKSARLPARFERVATHAILDGAHNPDKLRALAQTVRVLDYQRVHVLFGVGEKKAVAANLRALLPLATHWTLTQASLAHPKPLAARRLARALRKLQPRARFTVYPHANTALTAALRVQRPGELLLITGSFYLAGELREHWFPKRSILEKRTPFP